MKTDKQVIFTGSIPQCPYCDKPTKRFESGRKSTLLGWLPKYDENGIRINNDPNTHTTYFRCVECDMPYGVEIRVNNSKYLLYEK